MTELLPCRISDEARKRMSSQMKERWRNNPEQFSHETHGAYLRDKRLYNVWTTMLHRCENPNRERYKDYGGRGINVCAEWHDPNTFMDWAESNGYEPGLQLDRIDNSGDYSPDNCRWSTPSENCRHTRRTKYLTLNGETKCVAEWCETLPISQYTIYDWYRKYGKEGCEERVYKRLSETS